MQNSLLIKLSCLSIAWLITANVYAQNNEHAVNPLELPAIEVIGSTPLSAVGTDAAKYTGNVQTLSADDIEKSNPTDLSELLIRSINSINVNTSQNNPYQNDIFYRGFLASSLVGSAVGLSVYIDGVRINEGFGDTINWDLIPESAISTINVLPGSNPLFGLNTLGGALALRTKSGRSFQGTEIETSGGSWGRSGIELEHGNYHGEYDWYLLANIESEDGWRERSPSEVEQFFAKFGWETDVTDIDISITYNDNDLIGNGLASERLLALDDEAVHTFPDNTINELNHFNLQASHQFNDLWQLAFNAFHRDYERSTLNGDAETVCNTKIGDEDKDIFLDNMQEDELVPSLCGGTVGDAAMRSGQRNLFDEDGNTLTNSLMLERKSGGEQRTSLTETKTSGGTLQSTFTGSLAKRHHQLTFGVDYSRIESRFLQTEAEAELQRFGNSVGTVNPDTQEVAVNVDTEQRNLSLYFTDTLDINESVALTFSGRWQDVESSIRDRTGESENADLNGDHDFHEFSPAFGSSYQTPSEMVFFANYSEGFRTPTATELTCADPDDPCNLPNAFVADPPLKPVIAKTVELGIRGQLAWGDGILWDATIYQTQLQDDLLFTVTETGGGGFFQNVNKTERQGLELGIKGDYESFFFFASYAYIDATFESRERLASVVDAAGINIRPGNQIPGIPNDTFKLGVTYQWLPKLLVGGNLFYSAGSFLRGDEANQLAKTGGYTIVHLNAHAYISDNIELWAKLDNVFDKEYETTGAINFNANAGLIFGDDIQEERFVAPGAPLAAWLGVKLRF